MKDKHNAPTSPIIDVVTVWYNRGYRVEQSIGSIISQDLTGYRVFAVDDGSTDDTLERLEAMVVPARERGVELIVWAKKNEGFTRSLKRIIEERTSAPYIGLHGAGDISYPQRLSTLLRVLEDHEEAVAAGCGVRVTTPTGTTISTRIPTRISEEDLVSMKIPRPATHECAVIRRQSYDMIGGYREFFTYAQDSDLWVRLARVGPIINTKEILFDKVEIPESVSVNWKKSLLQRKYSVLAVQAGRIAKEGEPDLIDRLTPSERDRWQEYVDPRLLLRRYRFWKRIGKNALEGRLSDAAGLCTELLKTYAKATAWWIRTRR